MHSEKSSSVHPRIIIHGGAGNITRQNLPLKAYISYRTALLDVLQDAYARLRLPGATALDVATHAVTLLENNALFNAGHGAVFTTVGTHELEASVMVSRGYRKRGVGVMNVTRAKNPIKLAREMLIRGDEEDGGGAQGHCQLQGETCDRLAEEWGLETVTPSYFWTRKRWDEHRTGIGKKHDGGTYEKHKRRADMRTARSCSTGIDAAAKHVFDESAVTIDESWDGKEYLPQGTVGAVVLDSTGAVCCATSTGGLTNKLPGRIGDTPTLGAGFWAEEWVFTLLTIADDNKSISPSLPQGLSRLFSDCFPGLSDYIALDPSGTARTPDHVQRTRAVAMSGTGNGDSFLRLSAVRTAAAMARFQGSSSGDSGYRALQNAVTAVAGPGGMLQQSAEDRWHKTGEGEGGIIGIECNDGQGQIVFDFNCGGMFHAWIDAGGKARFQVFWDEID
ncbi:hypothetical protein LTR37_011888 [Vermiconidia calcicola]|uniref:Uncharacterized protein n=1 Tax=Vermiconidia calcicola TaxID=1690605 RepID=A0ACC3N3G2_9PEZI|nr:hypothetical protein LTR37_011888 [Vermiconidia calcicola]